MNFLKIKNVDKIKKTLKNVTNVTGIKHVKTFFTSMPETAARPEHSSTRLSPSAYMIVCSAAPGTAPLASCSSSNQLQTGSSHIQNPQYIYAVLPQPSHQTSGICPSSPLFRCTATVQADHQNPLCWSCFPLHGTHRLELSSYWHYKQINSV